MSDEKRPTRLLKFRLRRDGAARRAAQETAAEFSGDAEDFSGDVELGALLRAWKAPTPSDEARGRLLSDFRASVRPAPLWRRALSADVRVPLPVAACAALALLASLLALAARTRTHVPATTAHNAPAEVHAAEPTPTVKIVEVPVERERVVTRFVYVEKNPRAAEAQQLASTQQSGATRRNLTTRAAFAQSNSNGEAAGGVRAATDSGPQSAGEPTSYFTRVDMADFQPAEKMELRIVKRGKTDEK